VVTAFAEFGADDEATVVLGDDDIIVVEDGGDAAYGSDPIRPPVRRAAEAGDYVDGDVTVEIKLEEQK
jgi:hypothetical protein